MNALRKYVSSAVGFCFVIVGITGLIFKFAFKNHPLEEIHGGLGVALVAAAVFHIRQNWGSLKSYLKSPRVLALLIPVLGLSAVLGLDSDEEERKGPSPKKVVQALTHSSIEDLARAFHADSNAVAAKMTQDGLQGVTPGAAIEAVAKTNQKKPEELMSYFVQ